MAEIYDVIIIGGGPAGLTAAQYTARANLKVIVLDKPQSAGALALSGHIENYPGLSAPVSGRELLDTFRDQALKFGAIYRSDPVASVNFDAEVKEVYGLEHKYMSRAVIIATGSMARKADIPGEADYLGKGVSYCATCDAAFFRGQTVCVVGDSGEALHEAEFLTEFAKTVFLVISTDEPKRRVPSRIQVVSNSRLVAIEGDHFVTGVRIKRRDSGEEQLLQSDGVFILLHGAIPSVDFLDTSVPRGGNACILTHQSTLTSIPGVYAAGDVTCAAVRQVVVSAAMGCIAALEAEKYIRQRRGYRYDWSKLNK